MLNFVILFLKNKNGLSPLLLVFELVLVPAKIFYKVDAKSVLVQSNCILEQSVPAVERIGLLARVSLVNEERNSLYLLLNQVSFGQELKIHIAKSTFTLISQVFLSK